MDKNVQSAFNDRTLAKAVPRYGIIPADLSFIGAFQNFVYEYEKDARPYILRLTPSTTRSAAAVRGELEWVRYLADHGAAVSRPVRTMEGEPLEVVEAEGLYFTIAAFEKAPGTRIGYPECLTDTVLFERMGELTGRLHKLSKLYVPSTPSIRRHEWRDNYYLRKMGACVPASQTRVHESCRSLMSDLRELTKEPDAYGLIHGDINVANFTVSEAGITLFDFDECQYSWFVEDIAIPLYYFVYVYGDDSLEEREAQALLFMDHFMKGYEREHAIESRWLAQMPLFLRLREIIVYTGMYRSWDMTKLDEWARDYITQSRNRIENGIPVVNWSG